MKMNLNNPTLREKFKPSALIAIAICLAVVVLFPIVVTSRYIVNLVILAAASGVAALGLTVCLGYTGLLSMAQAVFYSIGSYAVALCTTRMDIGWWGGMFLGLVLAALMGLFLGFASLKVSGRYLAMVTICVQVVFALVLMNWREVTNGADGISGIGRPWLFTELDDAQKFCWFSLAVLFICVLIIWALKTSKLGRSMRAVRENEMAAECLGVNTLRVKVIAFLICGVLGSLGGSLYASGFLYISPDSFVYQNSVDFLSMVLVGGTDSAFGAVIGASILTFLPEALCDLESLYLVIYGCIIIVVIIFMPDGLWGYVDRFMRRFSKKKMLPEVKQALAVGECDCDEVLHIENIGMHFGGLKALDGVDYAVHKGEIHALIGPNGSGKTTCINVISGIYTPTFGKVTFLGEEITGMKPHIIARKGLTRTFQNLRLFSKLSVYENVLVGSQRAGGSEEEIIDRALAAIEFVGLKDVAYEQCRSLPYGHQKLVELARNLAGKPKLLLLDEPAAGLNESEKEMLGDLLIRIHKMGLTMLLVEHDMSLISKLATKCTVLNFGEKIADGDVDEALTDPQVVEAYLGTKEVSEDDA